MLTTYSYKYIREATDFSRPLITHGQLNNLAVYHRLYLVISGLDRTHLLCNVFYTYTSFLGLKLT